MFVLLLLLLLLLSLLVVVVMLLLLMLQMAAGGRRSGLVGGHIIQLSLCLAFKMSFLAESPTKQTPKMQCVEPAE